MIAKSRAILFRRSIASGSTRSDSNHNINVVTDGAELATNWFNDHRANYANTRDLQT